MPTIDWKPAPASWRRAENGDDTDDADDGNSIGSSSLEDARVSPLLTVRRSNPLLWHACTIVTLGVAWAVPVALLATVVALLGRTGAPPPLTIVHAPKLPTHELTNLSGNASRNWSRHISRNASKPVAPAKVEYGAVNEPFDGFGKLNNASAAFMTCWWNRTRAKLKLQVPAAALGRTEFVVSAMVSRGDGVHALLHEPLTATDTNVYRLDLAPNGVDLDLVQPQLALRLPPNGSLPERTFAYGAWSGWLRTFRATKVTEWHLRPLPINATNATNATEALPNRTNASEACAHHHGPPTLWRSGTDPPKPKKKAAASPPAAPPAPPKLPAPPAPKNATVRRVACGYVAASTSYIIDVSEWLLGGAGVLDSDLKLSDSRLTGARAFPSNLEVQLQAHVGEANGDDDEEEEKGDAMPPPAAQLQISLAELPPRDPAVVARAADDRIGFWNLHFTELGSTTAADAPLSSRKADREVRVVHRWHLTSQAARRLPPRPSNRSRSTSTCRCLHDGAPPSPAA